MASFAASRLALAAGALLPLLCTVPAPPASADPVLIGSSGSARVTLDFFGAGLPSRTDEETFGPSGGAAVAEVGRNRAVQTGTGINAVNVEARLSDVPEFLFRADTDIAWNIENTGPDLRDLTFDYTINGGRLRLFDPTGSFHELESTVAVSIFTIAPDFGGFLWEWGVTLRGTAPGVVATQVHGFATIFPFDDPLGLGSPTVSAVSVSATEAVVSIAPFTATVHLGEMEPGARASIIYSMFGQVSGPSLRDAGASATVGDPFNLAGTPGSVLSFNGAAAVPEPSVVVLTGLGVAALVRRMRSRR